MVIDFLGIKMTLSLKKFWYFLKLIDGIYESSILDLSTQLNK